VQGCVDGPAELVDENLGLVGRERDHLRVSAGASAEAPAALEADTAAVELLSANTGSIMPWRLA
jgi:hypothetical protein